jgi:hypothetical protein
MNKAMTLFWGIFCAWPIDTAGGTKNPTAGCNDERLLCVTEADANRPRKKPEKPKTNKTKQHSYYSSTLTPVGSPAQTPAVPPLLSAIASWTALSGETAREVEGERERGREGHSQNTRDRPPLPRSSEPKNIKTHAESPDGQHTRVAKAKESTMPTPFCTSPPCQKNAVL